MKSKVEKPSMNLHKCLPISFLEKNTAQNNVVCANAGMAIATVTNVPLLKGFEIAKNFRKGLKALNIAGG
jgi:hypothetical protein